MRGHSTYYVCLLIASVFVLGSSLTSCGGDESETSSIPRIHDPGKKFTLSDLKEIGFKKSKTYDAQGLIGVESVYYGFWGLDPYDRKDYEARFFSSHSDAVELGTAQADERSGADAILDEEESTWPVGMKDARQCGGDKGAGPVSHGIQNCKSPKYWDFSIYGNMILLCSGGNVEAAHNLCNDLLVALDPPPAVN